MARETVLRHEIPWDQRPKDKFGHMKKGTIPAQVRREIATRHGCQAGGEASACCHFCQKPGSIAWIVRGARAVKGWVAFCDLELDHLFPESRGGTTTADNIVLACRRCNRSRGNRTVEEWISGLAA